MLSYLVYICLTWIDLVRELSAQEQLDSLCTVVSPYRDLSLPWHWVTVWLAVYSCQSVSRPVVTVALSDSLTRCLQLSVRIETCRYRGIEWQFDSLFTVVSPYRDLSLPWRWVTVWLAVYSCQFVRRPVVTVALSDSLTRLFTVVSPYRDLSLPWRWVTVWLAVYSCQSVSRPVVTVALSDSLTRLFTVVSPYRDLSLPWRWVTVWLAVYSCQSVSRPVVTVVLSDSLTRCLQLSVRTETCRYRGVEWQFDSLFTVVSSYRTETCRYSLPPLSSRRFTRANTSRRFYTPFTRSFSARRRCCWRK